MKRLQISITAIDSDRTPSIESEMFSIISPTPTPREAAGRISQAIREIIKSAGWKVEYGDLVDNWLDES
jgi:hypothetical protein